MNSTYYSRVINTTNNLITQYQQAFGVVFFNNISSQVFIQQLQGIPPIAGTQTFHNHQKFTLESYLLDYKYSLPFGSIIIKANQTFIGDFTMYSDYKNPIYKAGVNNYANFSIALAYVWTTPTRRLGVQQNSHLYAGKMPVTQGAYVPSLRMRSLISQYVNSSQLNSTLQVSVSKFSQTFTNYTCWMTNFTALTQDMCQPLSYGQWQNWTDLALLWGIVAPTNATFKVNDYASFYPL